MEFYKRNVKDEEYEEWFEVLKESNEKPGECEHIGTAQVNDGLHVFHVFEII